MALPTFEYDRRIDIVDALNELSTAADAAIEAGGGSSSAVTDQHINDLINARLKTVLATATVGADGTMTFTV